MKILQQDKIRMRPYVGQEAEIAIGKNKKLYFLSTTRSKRGGYTTANKNYGVFTLDGRKLAQRYKGSPIEYWGADTRNIDPERRTTEMEDRIYGDKPEIPNFSKYIKDVHIMIDDTDLDDKQKRRMRATMIAGKKRGIEVYFYNSPNDFLNHNKRKAIKIDVKSLKTPAVEPGGFGGSSRMKQMVKKDLGPILELILSPVTSKLSKDAKETLRNIEAEYYQDGVAKNIANTISNNAKDNYPAVNKLVKEMQKRGFKRPMELVKWLRKKWIKDEDK